MSLTVITVTVTLDHKSRHSNMPQADVSILRDEYQGLLGITLPQTSTAPAGKPSQGKLVFQSSIFRCELLVAGRVDVKIDGSSNFWGIADLFLFFPRGPSGKTFAPN